MGINARNIATTLEGIAYELDMPVAYSHFKTDVIPPFLVYIGAGQNQGRADSTVYWRKNAYQVEYYFREKNEVIEASIEDALLADGWVFTKSDDSFIEGMGVFVIFYDVN